MKIGRILRHLLIPDWIAKRPFKRLVLAHIEERVGASERRHGGELRVVVEGSLDPLAVLRGQSPRERAQDLFGALAVWDTAQNSGVLIYLQMVDHVIEIVADRGIAARVAQAEWDTICRQMEAAFRVGEFERGTLEAIDAITELLAIHFPASGDNPDELPDRPLLL